MYVLPIHTHMHTHSKNGPLIQYVCIAMQTYIHTHTLRLFGLFFFNPVPILMVKVHRVVKQAVLVGMGLW
jgi:hypothetical protein